MLAGHNVAKQVSSITVYFELVKKNVKLATENGTQNTRTKYLTYYETCKIALHLKIQIIVPKHDFLTLIFYLGFHHIVIRFYYMYMYISKIRKQVT